VNPLNGSTTTDFERVLPEQVQKQVGRILRSKIFRNAPALQRLLNHVTVSAANGQADQLKEYTIGSAVFGRGVNYDPKIDTVVRVEMHRLREKLREYYEAEGADDAILIEIPKGHYFPKFDIRPSSISAGPSQEPETSSGLPDAERSQSDNREPARAGKAGSPRGSWFLHWGSGLALAGAVFASGLLAGAWWGKSGPASRSAGSSTTATQLAPQSDAAVQEFWRSFLGKDAAPIIGYPDAVFLIDQTNDLFRFRRGASDDRGAPVDPHLARQFASNPFLIAKAGPLFYEDGYTGTGELESVALLARLFTEMRLAATVKRCREVTIDDLKQHSVILLGSSFQNEVVSQLPWTGDFVFDNPDQHRELWMGRIINLHPRRGEKAVYRTERDPVTQVVTADYALVTIQRVVPGRFIAVLGGLDTTGTEGATQFATSKLGIQELSERLKSLGVSLESGTPPSFQALLRVTVTGGQDVLGVRPLAVHLIRSADSRPSHTPR
jgi:hypothetical protein